MCITSITRVTYVYGQLQETCLFLSVTIRRFVCHGYIGGQQVDAEQFISGSLRLQESE